MAEKYPDATYAIRGEWEGAESYYPRGVSGDWVLSYGVVREDGGHWKATVNDPPARFWPAVMAEDASFTVIDDAEVTVKGAIVGQAKASTPAGRFPVALLTRYTQTPKPGVTTLRASTWYEVCAPTVGWIATIHPADGEEASGFTSVSQLDFLKTMPAQ